MEAKLSQAVGYGSRRSRRVAIVAVALAASLATLAAFAGDARSAQVGAARVVDAATPEQATSSATCALVSPQSLRRQYLQLRSRLRTAKRRARRSKRRGAVRRLRRRVVRIGLQRRRCVAELSASSSRRRAGSGPAPASAPATGASPGAGAPASESPPAAQCASLTPLAEEQQAPACWRPYADSSPWNQELSDSARIDSRSGQIVGRLLSWGAPQNMLAGTADTGSDYYHPIYFAQATDPVYTLDATENWGSNEIDGMQVRIPSEARPAGGGDAHLAVIAPDGWEYDLWNVESKPAGGGTLRFAWGGRTRVDGDGLGSNATAAHFGLAGGVIRAPELEAGRIEHALFMGVKCTDDREAAVYPAEPGTGEPCSDLGLANGDAPPMGARFVLEMSDAEIAALPAPQWKKTILTALADYGMFVGDRIGSGAWGLQFESGSTYTSFGETDRVAEFARREGLPTWSGKYVFEIGGGVDWAGRLKLVDPCVTAGTC